MRELFLAFLAQHDDAAWLRVVDRIAQSIHPVDRVATRIWFHFYPLSLQRLMERSDAVDLARQMTLAGRWRLADRVDTSHEFLYGHQYWQATKRVVLNYVAGSTPSSLDLGAQIQEVAARVAQATGGQASVLVGITAIALRTLHQVGPDVFEVETSAGTEAGRWARRTANQIVAMRERRTVTGWRRLFGGATRESLVTFNERDPSATFPLIHSQHLTTAAALDGRCYRASEPRCSEGPIPVHLPFGLVRHLLGRRAQRRRAAFSHGFARGCEVGRMWHRGWSTARGRPLGHSARVHGPGRRARDNRDSPLERPGWPGAHARELKNVVTALSTRSR